MHQIKAVIAGILSLLTVTVASAQTSLPYHSVWGRIGAAPGDTGPGQAIPFATLIANLAQAGPNVIRQKMLGNPVFYVDDINGKDTNACITATSGACKTLNGVGGVIGGFDLNWRDVTVNVAAPASSYAGMSCLQPWVGYGSVTFVGNTTTPTNVLVAGGSGAAFDIENGCSVILRGFSVSSTGNNSIQAILGGRIVMSKMDLASAASAVSAVYSSRNASYLEINDSFGATTVHTGIAAAQLFQASHTGELRVACSTACLSFTANVTYTYTILADNGEVVATPSASFALNANTVTANKYRAMNGGRIQWNGNMAPCETDIPGSIAGSGLALLGTDTQGPTFYSTGGRCAAASVAFIAGGTQGVAFTKQDGSANTFLVDNSGNPTLLSPSSWRTALGLAAVASSGSASDLSAGTVPSARGGAGAINGALKSNGSGVVSQAACADLSNATAGCSAAAGQLPGTATSDSASAGNIGEYIEARCQPNSVTATVTVTIASPAVVTWTAHGFNGTAPRFDLCPVVFTTTGALPTGITAGTAYYVIPSTIAANTFQIATSPANAIAGTAVNTTGSQSGTQTGTAGLPLTTATGFNFTAISLTAGDWDVAGFDNFTGASTTNVVALQTYLSTSSLSLTLVPGYSNVWYTGGNIPFANVTQFSGFTVGPSRFSLSATTTVYYVLFPTFSTSTLNGFPTVRARRVR